MIERYKLYYRTFIACFWIVMTWVFISEEFLPFLEGTKPMLYLLIDGVLFLLGLATLRQRGDMWVALSYVVLAIVSTIIINHLSVTHLLNGTRDFMGLIFAVPILRYFFTSPYAGEFREKFDRQLYALLCIQVFCIVWQFVRYGANDHGGGSLGYGGSGIISMMIYLLSFYFITKEWDADHFLSSLWANRKYVFLLFPTFLNETKISFVLFLLYFILLMKFDRKALIRMVIAVPLLIVSFVGVVSLYMNITNQNAEEVFSEEFVTHYLYGNDLDELVEIALMVQDEEFEMDSSTFWVEDIPRFGKIVLIIPKLQAGPGGLWLGRGVGQFKGGTLVENTPFYKDNEWLMFGSKTWTFNMLAQLGIIGLLWFLAVIVRDLRVGKSMRPYSRQIQLYLAACVAIVMLYNDSFRVFSFCTVMFYMVFAMRYCRPETSENAESESVETDKALQLP